MFRTRQSHSYETLRVLTLARQQLSPAVSAAIGAFLHCQHSPAGGFCDRRGRADLYYTLFGLLCAAVLPVELPLPRVSAWLDGIDSAGLDMVHVSCLVKCRTLVAALSGSSVSRQEQQQYADRIALFRTADGGFSYDGQAPGFPYAAFVALNCYQDLECQPPDQRRLLRALSDCRAANGGFLHPGAGAQPMLLSTLAAIQVIRHLTGDIDAAAVHWVRGQRRSNGGFPATPQSRLPDLLATGTALFTLATCGENLRDWRQSSQEFIADHWDAGGGFRATVADDVCDCEYTYYGLLALGSLYVNAAD